MWKNSTLAGSPPCSPQTPSERPGLGRAALARPRSGPGRRPRRCRSSRRGWSGPVPREVLGQESPLGVVAGEAERGLGQVVGAEAEEVGFLGDLLGDQAGPRQLDHRPDRARPVRRRLPRSTSLIVRSTDGPEQFEFAFVGDQWQHDLDLGRRVRLRRPRRVQPRRSPWPASRRARAAGSPRRAPRVPSIGLTSSRSRATAEAHLGPARPPCVAAFAGLGELAFEAGDRDELVERRIEQPDRHRQALHHLEQCPEVLALDLAETIETVDELVFQRPAVCASRVEALAPGQLAGDEHLADQLFAVGAEEHVLGAAEPDALGAHVDRVAGVFGGVGIGPDARACGSRRPSRVLR